LPVDVSDTEVPDRATHAPEQEAKRMTTTHDLTVDARPHSPERETTLDAAFDALADRQCRDLLARLDDGEVLVVTDLAARLADDESDEARLRTRLHHNVLPKLDRAGLVEYDSDRGLVQYRPDTRSAGLSEAASAVEADDLPVALDALLDLLASFRRREALLTLLAHDDLSLPDLADEVAVAEHDRSLPRIDPDDVLRVYLSLYHTHVPKLVDAGLVEYDQADDYVSLTGTGRAVESAVRELCDPADG
jgi:DNA-binding transcriptional ArsR family regulator